MRNIVAANTNKLMNDMLACGGLAGLIWLLGSGCAGTDVDDSAVAPTVTILTERDLERYDTLIDIASLPEERFKVGEAVVEHGVLMTAIRTRCKSGYCAVVYKHPGKAAVDYNLRIDLVESACQALNLDLFMDEPISRQNKSGTAKSFVWLVKRSQK